ncbi:dipeptide/oligopeptide/nickel ABC transporter permease/ATP-binding protein [Dactylosporangium sp. CA-233914]|uniref:dipeptide/oligopeptide/nickel ABC transporter permease/ATP-binding protein n=1 Tax=Dactylosporangium sp. CA-233914 TaxID=3239934 RepID=UPI003D931D24
MSATILESASSPRAGRPGAVGRLIRNPLGMFALLTLSGVLLAGAIGPLVAPFDPSHADLAKALLPPGSQGHLLGTDSAGRDVLSRLLQGAQNTLLAAGIAAVVAIVVGLPSGLLAGYFGGWFDAVASWCTNVVMSLPSIIILLAATSALGKTVWVSMTIFGMLMSPSFFRLVRAAVQSVRHELYVDAARVSGLSTARILGRHILAASRSPLIIQASMVCGIAMSISATLEFLGLGDPLVATWGVMLNEGFVNIYTAPQLVVWPGIAISVTIGCFVLLGNALRDTLEDPPRPPRRRPARRLSTAAPTAPTVAPAPSTTLLEVSGLRVGYPHRGHGFKNVVEDVSFHLARGEVLGIVGESGSGKTQTAFSVLGLLPREARILGGRIRFDTHLLLAEGEPISARAMQPLRGGRIAYVPQEPMSNLDPNFRVGQQLARPIVKVLGLSKAQAEARVLELLDTVGIANPRRVFRAYPHQLSGGMAQRVLIAGAVSCEPDLLIADEPTTALDVTVQADVLDLLRELRTASQMSVLLVTHNFGVVADLCDRVAVMQQGRVVETGEVRDILRSPHHEYTRTLLAATLENKPARTFLGPRPTVTVEA